MRLESIRREEFGLVHVGEKQGQPVLIRFAIEVGVDDQIAWEGAGKHAEKCQVPVSSSLQDLEYGAFPRLKGNRMSRFCSRQFSYCLSPVTIEFIVKPCKPF